MPKSEYLMQTGIVKESGVVFSPLFEEYVRKNLISSTAFLTISEKVISRCGVDINDLLNPQEFNVFMKMYENANEVVTREQIAQAMWGSKFEEKYSEWAIDQTISRIRKKLIDHDKKHIQTVKNEGIKLAI